jgi:hypothetical protein
MKKSIVQFAVFACSIAFIAISCASPAEKVEKAQDQVVEANNNLDTAIKNYQEDINAYRIETANRIAANELAIAKFNVKIANEKKEAKADYLKKIAALEKRNTEMKVKLQDYKDDGDSKWKTFKVEFSKEMDDLGESIKDLTTKDDD